ncbi:MAG: sn-glycerol-3-phosphate ABC transporter ATP-binding protein UgpC [Chitinispirillia bacterium]|jgi:multiple sugar transport system ATP-binding protein
MADVQIKNLVKQFGNTEVLHSINLEIADSEFIVLVGPSGCGKSTTLRLIAGLEEVTSGEIFINEKIVNDVAPKDRDIAMVFQNYALYPHMNVFNNMAFGLKLRKIPKETISKKVRDAAKILKMEDLLDRKPSQLSGGQRQRVAMGRAIVRDPQIFLFDEPLSNLDAKLRNQMRVEIKQLHQKLNCTMIYVTHDQVEAMTLGDTIVVMRDGYIEQIGNPLELFQNPANRFVAGFIGTPSMNLVRASIVGTEGKTGVETKSGFRIIVPEKTGAGIKKGQEVIIGIRPQYLTTYETGEKTPEEWVKSGIVNVVEPLGNETHLHITIDGVKFIALCEGSNIFNPGTKMKFSFNLNHLHIFDAETEKSIY